MAELKTIGTDLTSPISADFDEDNKAAGGTISGENQCVQEDEISLPTYMALRIHALSELDDRYSELRQEYARERSDLEEKYAALADQIFVKRTEIISAGSEKYLDIPDTPTVLAKNLQSLNLTGERATDKNPSSDDHTLEVPGVPNFWLCTMANSEEVSAMVSEIDLDCLEYLTDIRCEMHHDCGNIGERSGEEGDSPDVASGFTLSFHFDAQKNPYFKNSVLTKRYEVPNMYEEEGDPLLHEVTGCVIDWRPRKCFTHRTVKKKRRSTSDDDLHSLGNKYNVIKRVPVHSFFHFFNPPKLQDADPDVLDEDELGAVEEIFHKDYEVATAIRCQLIPRAVQWFIGDFE